jgi:hypothetical protein
LKKQFINLMKEVGVMPIEEPTWNCFVLEHKVTPCNDLKKVRQYVNNHIQNTNGLYAYKDMFGNILYIGKGKPIKDRVYSHYIETYKQVSGDRSGKWHRFFNKYHDNLTIYWFYLKMKV